MTGLLEKSLGRVAAPAELWNRVEMPRPEVRKQVFSRWTAVAAAACLLVGAFEFRASRQMASSNAREIRSWVLAKTGLEVPLDSHPPAVTRLSGARLVGAHTAEIALTAAAGPAILRVERAVQNFEGHGHPNTGAKTSSWIFQGARFTLEADSPQTLETACRLCHG